jgi:hypothetical protein
LFVKSTLIVPFRLDELDVALALATAVTANPATTNSAANTLRVLIRDDHVRISDPSL